MMKRIRMKIIFTLFLIAALPSLAYITPSKNTSKAPSQEPYINYQWALFNDQQIITTDIDDIHPKEYRADSAAHINWINLDASMKRDVIVAVLDSGIDTSHPEFKNKLLPGFNFTASDPNKAKIVDDDVGHGTHIAGIISANNSNNEGIAGLSNRIKILPLKVYDSSEGRSRRSKSNITDRVALAIEYALKQKVDVINLSMGWPRVADTERVRKAFQEAHNQGVLVVAAAGNDNHSGQIFPCAYDNVICVGSININNTISEFSNFGGHIDILAPGQEILSTWPLLMTSMHFGPKGYELKTGTSQAAPFVSGALGILKGLYPNESTDQITIRLLKSADEIKGQGYGRVNLKKAVATSPTDFFQPQFSGLEMVDVDTATRTFSFKLKIKKTVGLALQTSIESLTPHVQITEVKLHTEEDVTSTYLVHAKVTDLTMNNLFSLLAKINDRSFKHEMLMVVPLKMQKTLDFEIPKTDFILKNDLRSVPDQTATRIPRYWSFEVTEEKKFTLHLWELNQNKVLSKKVTLDNVSEPQPGFNLLASDWDSDGKTDFLFSGIEKNEKNEILSIHLIYLDSNLNVSHRFILDYEGVLPTFKNAKDILVGNYRQFKVPAFWDTGLIPRSDRNSDEFAFESNTNSRRLYYLEPNLKNGEMHFSTRTLTASKLDKVVRQHFNLDASTDVQGLGTTFQNFNQTKSGQIQLLMTIGRGINVRIIELNFYDLENPWESLKINVLPVQKFDLANNRITDAWNLNQQIHDSSTAFHSIFSRVAARAIIKNEDQFLMQNLSLPDKEEQIIGILKSFFKGQDNIHQFETSDYIRFKGQWWQKKVNEKIKVYRSSFLPGKLFSQLFVPILDRDNHSPAIFFDNSPLFSNTTLIYHLDKKGKLVSPINKSLHIPEECIGRSPIQDKNGIYRLVFLCTAKENLYIKVW